MINPGDGHPLSPLHRTEGLYRGGKLNLYLLYVLAPKRDLKETYDLSTNQAAENKSGRGKKGFPHTKIKVETRT